MAVREDRQDGFLVVVAAVAEALAPSSTPYCIIGALALGAWGQPRATQDVDLLVMAESTAPDAFVGPLTRKGFYRDEPWLALNPMAKDRVLRLKLGSCPDFPVDLIFPTDDFDQSALTRRQAKRIHGMELWVCSPEDLILLKLRAGRPHDFDDVMSVVKNPHLRLDLEYLWHWADRLGLQGELHYVLQAAGSG